MTGYYDIVLGLIPVALVGIIGALTVAGFSLTLAISLASLVAVGLIGHGMFINAPTVSSSTHSQADGSVSYEAAD